MTGDSIRVILADDHNVVRAGLRAVLGVAKDIEVIGEAKTGTDAVAMAERFKPDAVTVVAGSRLLRCLELDGRAALKEIVAKGLSARVLILTMHSEEEYLIPLLEAGAAGYLVKSVADRELVDAVRAIAHGDVYIPLAGARVLVKNLTKKDPAATERDQFEKLTERERDVLKYIAQGYSAPEIGEKLFLSPKTVETYKQRVHEKLGFAHRSDYVQFALKLGLLTEA